MTGHSRRTWLALSVVLLAAAGGAAIWWANRPHPIVPSVEPSPDEPPTPTGPGWFRDATAGSGIDFTYRNGEEANHLAILESLGGGVALIDYDGDGLLDVFVTGGGFFAGPENKEIKGRPCKLFKNLGGFKFRDVTAEAGLDREWWYTHGVAVADYDRDGWPDLLVTGYGHIAMFHNEPDGKGGRKFRDVTDEVGLKDTAWATSAGWADLDGDGYPDLYVCHYVDWSFANHPVCKGTARDVPRDICNPEVFKPLVHALFHNEKGKGFRDVAAEQGFKADGCGLGVVLADLNGDGRPDVYVANDTNLNYLLLNRGGGKLEGKGLLTGAVADETGHPDGSMGVDVGDFEGTGRPGIFVTNFQNEVHALYQNVGRELFRHQSRAAGVAALSRQLVGFGTAFADFDNDGWEDLVFVNGHVWRYPVSGDSRQKPVLLRNGEADGRRFFTDVSRQAGPYFQTPALGRGLAVGDLDNDGWPDLVVSHTNSPVAVLRNEAAATHSHRWLGIKLIGKGNRCVVGSTATLQIGGRTLTRFTKGGGSYLSASDPRLRFGLGEATAVGRLTVKWSWGETETWDGLEPGAYWELTEGQSTARRLPGPPR